MNIVVQLGRKRKHNPKKGNRPEGHPSHHSTATQRNSTPAQERALHNNYIGGDMDSYPSIQPSLQSSEPAQSYSYGDFTATEKNHH
jgi:hypothetical protein